MKKKRKFVPLSEYLHPNKEVKRVCYLAIDFNGVRYGVQSLSLLENPHFSWGGGRGEGEMEQKILLWPKIELWFYVTDSLIFTC